MPCPHKSIQFQKWFLVSPGRLSLHLWCLLDHTNDSVAPHGDQVTLSHRIYISSTEEEGEEGEERAAVEG